MENTQLFDAIRAKRRMLKYLSRILRYAAKFKPIKYDGENKEIGNYTFLMIFNAESFDMARACLYSYFMKSDSLPKSVILVSDGSWSVDKGKYYFRAFKNVNLIFEHWNASIQYHKKKQRMALVEYANKQIWGKKLACILRFAENEATLFSDPDILWFKSPPQICHCINNDQYIRCQQGENFSYDQGLIDKLKANFLLDMPHVNAGIVLIKGNFFKNSKYLNDSIEIEAGKPGDFSEQTILALLLSEFGDVFPYSEAKSKIDDLLSFSLKKVNYSNELFARHYVWLMKALYWRDFIQHF